MWVVWLLAVVPSVKINGLPALRKDDRIIEGGSQNTINTGESSVIIG